MVVERSSPFENPGNLDATGPHVLDIGASRLMPILEGTLLLRFAPEYLIVSIRIERRVNIAEIDALPRKLLELIQTVAAIHNARVHKGG
jgi:hypothetical protein